MGDLGKIWFKLILQLLYSKWGPQRMWLLETRTDFNTINWLSTKWLTTGLVISVTDLNHVVQWCKSLQRVNIYTFQRKIDSIYYVAIEMYLLFISASENCFSCKWTKKSNCYFSHVHCLPLKKSIKIFKLMIRWSIYILYIVLVIVKLLVILGVTLTRGSSVRVAGGFSRLRPLPWSRDMTTLLQCRSLSSK